jgi:NAD(P)-dependent dehydrogenase (short-subunit alcohol dehydrogenase family)
LIAQKFIPFSDITTEEADKLTNTNQRGSFLCCREEVRAMLKQPRKDIQGLSGSTPACERGCIVNVASATSLASMFHSGSYVPTAWGRYGMTKSAGKHFDLTFVPKYSIIYRFIQI